MSCVIYFRILFVGVRYTIIDFASYRMLTTAFLSTCTYTRVSILVQQERSPCYVADVSSIFGFRSTLRFGGSQYIEFNFTVLVVVRAAHVHRVPC